MKSFFVLVFSMVAFFSFSAFAGEVASAPVRMRCDVSAVLADEASGIESGSILADSIEQTVSGSFTVKWAVASEEFQKAMSSRGAVFPIEYDAADGSLVKGYAGFRPKRGAFIGFYSFNGVYGDALLIAGKLKNCQIVQ